MIQGECKCKGDVKGHNSRYRGEWPLRCWLRWRGPALAVPAAAAEVKYDPGDKVYFTYCYAHPPAARIKPGDTVVTRTRDASNDVFSCIGQDGRREARPHQGQPADRAVLCRGRGAGRHARGPHRQHRSQSRLRLGRFDSRLRAARAGVQDRDGDAAGARSAVRVASRQEPQGRHARPAQ